MDDVDDLDESFEGIPGEEEEEVDDDVELSPPPQMSSNAAPHYSNVQEMVTKLQTSSEKKAGKGRGRGKAKAEGKPEKVSSCSLNPM